MFLFSRFDNSHKKWTDSLETRASVVFSLELEIALVAVQSIH